MLETIMSRFFESTHLSKSSVLNPSFKSVRFEFDYFNIRWMFVPGNCNDDGLGPVYSSQVKLCCACYIAYFKFTFNLVQWTRSENDQFFK
mmetsp:Transcript_22108/g.50535  ORF Transcript_22108/g.50535 Transcript_22108/m.50535 type:complete len:90 (+) Transcript_22108:2247-2516(+)